MFLVNNQLVAQHIKYCSNSFTRMHGLMFSKKIVDTAYIFIFNRPLKIDLHMLFVFFPIDILWLDEHRQVQQVEENVQPWRPLVKGHHQSLYVIELPAGTIKKKKIMVGNQCDWDHKIR